MALARRMLMVMNILLISCMKTARAHDKDGHGMKKQMKMSVYIHDIFNVTSVEVAHPIAGPVTPIAAPFGSMFIFNDPMTEGADPTSARLGNVTWTLIGSMPNSGSSSTFLSTWTFVFFNKSSPHHHELRGLHGTLCASGVSTVYDAQPMPITGGTGSFAFVDGSLTVFPIGAVTFTSTFRLDLLLYWPPSAPPTPFS